MKTLKTITAIFITVAVISINGYSQNTTVKALLNKQESRTEIFNAILGDHQLMMEFMTAMKGNEHAMSMMKDNQKMMKMDGNTMGKHGEMKMKESHKNMHNGNMMSMMQDNPEMMKKMMETCMKDSSMRCSMAEMMTQHPEMMKTMEIKMEEMGMMKVNKPMIQNSSNKKVIQTGHSKKKGV